jgi:hypothetical protein
MAGMAGLSFGVRPPTSHLTGAMAGMAGMGQPMLKYQNPANAPPKTNAGTWASTGAVAKPAMVAQPQASAGLTDDPGLVSGLRPQPKPQAGLGETAGKPSLFDSPMGGLLQMFMNQMMGVKTPKPAYQAPLQPQAPVEEAAPNKFDRASRLFGIGADLL